MGSPGLESSDSQSRPWRWILLIFVAAVTLYAITLGHGFVFDDTPAIVSNTQIRSLAQLPEIFSSTAWAGSGWETSLYRPLTIATYAVNFALTGLAAWSYHLGNVILHGIASVLVFALARDWRLSLRASVLGALLFAAHPVHTEAVANVVGRKDLLPTVFALAMVLSHPWALRRGPGALAIPVLAFGAAMLSKETGAVAIGLVVLHDVLLPGRGVRPGANRRRLCFVYAGYAVVLAGFLAVRWSVVGGFALGAIPFFDNPTAQASTCVRLMTATAVIGRGLTLLAMPLRLSADYSYNGIPAVVSPMGLRFIGTVLVLVILLCWAVARRRTTPALLLALGWYAVALLPTSNVLFPVGTIFAERLLYLPSVAFCLVSGLVLARATECRPKWVSFSAVAVVLVLFGGQTVRYSLAWADEVTLFSVAARHLPDSTKAHQKLGEALLKSGRAEEAAAAQQRALAIAPNNYKALVNLAAAYVTLGRRDEAWQALGRALDVRPDDPGALYALGALCRDAGRMAEAGDYWRRALAADQNHARTLSDLGTLHFLRGELDQARDYWERAVRSNPAMASAWYNLGQVRQQNGDTLGAREAFKQFVEVGGNEYPAQVARVREMLEAGPHGSGDSPEP